MVLPAARTVPPALSLPADLQVSFRSVDGLHGSMLVHDAATCGVVLVHGGGATRQEGGFDPRLAAGLADAGLASLRFDLRAHGNSKGRPEELTLSSGANDVRAAAEFLIQHLGAGPVSLIAASFGGGIAVLHAARHPTDLDRLALINPLLHYQRRLVDQPDRWRHGHLTGDAAEALARDGYLPQSASVRHGRALLNEIFHLRPDRLLADVTAPTMIVHGTADTVIPVEWSTEAAPAFGNGGAELVLVEGMQHGVAMSEDPHHQHPQTRAWQQQTITRLARFLGGRLT
jgi:hypothetical protein